VEALTTIDEGMMFLGFAWFVILFLFWCGCSWCKWWSEVGGQRE